MEDNFGIKELYDVYIKTPFETKIGNREYEADEAIICFDKIMMAPLTEHKVRTSSSGGYGNTRLIDWENTSEVAFSISEGVISKVGLALLSNSILTPNKEETVEITYSEILESDENGEFFTKYTPVMNKPVIAITKNDNIKLKVTRINDNRFSIGTEYCMIIVTYSFKYKSSSESYYIGKRLLDGYLSLEGKFRLRDDADGHIKTGIIEMPRIQLMSDLNMRLGSNVGPHVYKFNILGLPVGSRENRYVCKMTILDKELPQSGSEF